MHSMNAQTNQKSTMTFDGYWEMAMEERERESNKIENVGYWAVVDSEGYVKDGKHSSQEIAINSFVRSYGHGIFNWSDFVQKGYKAHYVDVKKIKSEIARYQNMLK